MGQSLSPTPPCFDVRVFPAHAAPPALFSFYPFSVHPCTYYSYPFSVHPCTYHSLHLFMFIHVPTTLTLSLFIHVPTTQYHQGPCLSFQSSSSFIHVPTLLFSRAFLLLSIFFTTLLFFRACHLLSTLLDGWMDGRMDGWLEGYEQENTFSLGPVQLLNHLYTSGYIVITIHRTMKPKEGHQCP